MSFEKMKDLKGVHERSCMMIYHFSPKEMQAIQSVSRLTGIRDIITIEANQLETTVKDILDNHMQQGEDLGVNEKVIVFNNMPSSKVNLFIDGLKKMRMARPLIAVVTEYSINWTFKELAENLSEERAVLRNGNSTAH
ncbi:DUF3783 domain-containing protein [Cellulosilyticum ruminicola]|uniref:DUF3783 domain-containing protein n=1 Tax=Cellulosilyticum ruminicola TaxID=425254 RepID=UPI00155DC46A|nr:DUF3783 domain-containing protein [Cellulosilyticum ruminicola]